MKGLRKVKENIWTPWAMGKWIIVPTNGFIKKNGEAVMGRGVAKQAKIRFPLLPAELGRKLQEFGKEHIYLFHQYHLITFPVKEAWYMNADLHIIEKSLQELIKLNFDELPTPIYLPKVGCGNGKLNWKDVEPLLEKYLDTRFVVCDLTCE